MSRSHLRSSGERQPCTLDVFGRCRLCELIAPASPGYLEEYARDLGPATEDGPGEADRPTNPHAGRDLLVRGCDYRLDAVGLERGEGCGCTPMTRCLLGRGKWADDVFAVDYSDCLACIDGR